MTDYPEPLERCVSCAVRLPADLAHHPHDPDCTDRDLCYCATEPHCPLCCACSAPVPVCDGQVEAFPEASTRGLPKGRST